jgi:rhodanese-related sulfurtransferase
MKATSQLAVLAAIAIAAAATTWLVKGPPARSVACDPASIAPDEICIDQIPPDAAVLWVDARPRTEWSKNGMPGSVLWNLDSTEDIAAFEAEAAMRIIETPRVIVYCGDENCGVSRQVADRIRALGLDAEVFVLFGGWTALMEAGRIIDSRSGP